MIYDPIHAAADFIEQWCRVVLHWALCANIFKCHRGSGWPAETLFADCIQLKGGRLGDTLLLVDRGRGLLNAFKIFIYKCMLASGALKVL